MPVLDFNGTLDGFGDISPAALVALYDLAGELPGNGELTGTLVWWNDLDGSLGGAGELAGALAAFMPLDGTLAGAGDVAGSPAYWLIFGGVVSGLATVSTPTPTLTFLVGGQAQGFGTISDDLLIDLSGVLQGIGLVSGALVLSSPLPPGYLAGQGDLVEPVPLPLQGFGGLFAYMEVLQPPGPVCGCAVPPVKTFGYMQTLGKCDLTLCITDAFNNNFSPAVVTFALYQILRGGYRQLRGPTKRTPVMTPEGCYYAPVVIGDCGQPGDWEIVWSWQRYRGAACESRTETFRVLDQAGQNPCDPNRKQKYGWGC